MPTEQYSDSDVGPELDPYITHSSTTTSSSKLNSDQMAANGTVNDKEQVGCEDLGLASDEQHVKSTRLTVRQFLRKELIDDFHPCYFVSFLGCGITGNIFYGFPYKGRWLESFTIFCSILNGVQYDNKWSQFANAWSVSDILVGSMVDRRAAELETRNQKIITEVTALMLFFISIMLFHGVGAIFMVRLILCKIPSTSQIFTQFLPIGFVGQSSYSIMLFGNNMYNFIPDDALAKAFLVPSALGAYLLLAGGYIYLFIAIASCMSKSSPFAKNHDPEWTTKRFGLIKWNKGWWTMTFPVGTMSLANSEIAKGVAGYDFLFFKVMSAIIGGSLFIICIINLIGLSYCIGERFYKAFFIPERSEDVNQKV
ncbi:SSU1 [Candida metapsilosis]|uniref:SSU1 n=1 Tax=Candida metapsilosis TaxID=273372 RepID=A0A8H8DAF1_9ASCO|nr:SSU1 [Candida metapsilosis]